MAILINWLRCHIENMLYRRFSALIDRVEKTIQYLLDYPQIVQKTVDNF